MILEIILLCCVFVGLLSYEFKAFQDYLWTRYSYSPKELGKSFITEEAAIKAIREEIQNTYPIIHVEVPENKDDRGLRINVEMPPVIHKVRLKGSISI